MTGAAVGRVPPKDALQRLLDLLRPIGLYRLEPDTLVYCELCAYAAALDLLWMRADLLEKNLFVDSCDPARLADWERLLGLPVARADEAARRAMICAKLAITENDFDHGGMLRSILSAGLDGQLLEQPPMGALRIHSAAVIGGYASLDEVKAQVGAMLPAHLRTEYDLGVLTWRDFDAKELSFARLDEADVTWEWFDLNGEKLK